MYKVQFLIEIITPAFLGNAEQEISEIRPSEIKGLLRDLSCVLNFPGNL